MSNAVECVAESTLSHHRDRRTHIETLLDRSKYRIARGRLIMTQVYERQMHIRDLARLMGANANGVPSYPLHYI